MAGQAVSFLLMGIGVEFFNIALLLIGRTLSGIMAGSQPLAQSAIIDHSAADKKGRNLVYVTIVVSAGIVFGPLIGGIFSDEKLVTWFTLSTPFYIAAALALCATLWVTIRFPKDVRLPGQLHWTRPLSIIREGFANPKLRSLVFIFLCMQVGFSLFYQMIQIFVSTVFSFPTWEIGVFNGFMGIAFVLVVLFGIKYFLKFLTVEKLASISLLLTGIFLILPMIYPQETFVWFMAFLAAGFNMMAYGALMACFASSVGVTKQGWAVGLFSCLVGLSWTLTGLATNLINIIGLRWLIAIGGFFLIISYFLMDRRIRLQNR